MSIKHVPLEGNGKIVLKQTNPPSPSFFKEGTLFLLMASLIKEEVSADADGGFVKK